MIIFKDLITGDEMFADTYKYTCVDDCLYEVQCQHVSRKHGDVVLAGANPSAEELDEGTDDVVETGLDLVLNQRLVEAGMFSKVDYKKYMKTYTKELQEKWKENGLSEDEIKDAKAKITKAVTTIIGKFDSYSKFFLGESSNPDGMVALLEYREKDDGTEVPLMIFLKHGLEEEKV